MITSDAEWTCYRIAIQLLSSVLKTREPELSESVEFSEKYLFLTDPYYFSWTSLHRISEKVPIRGGGGGKPVGVYVYVYVCMCMCV